MKLILKIISLLFVLIWIFSHKKKLSYWSLYKMLELERYIFKWSELFEWISEKCCFTLGKQARFFLALLPTSPHYTHTLIGTPISNIGVYNAISGQFEYLVMKKAKFTPFMINSHPSRLSSLSYPNTLAHPHLSVVLHLSNTTCHVIKSASSYHNRFAGHKKDFFYEYLF